MTVPSGAQTGDIRVRVSHPTQLEQVSNSLPFQVVWEFLDLEPIFSQYDFVSWSLNALSQGWENGPDIVFSINGRVGSWTRKRLWAIGQDSSESLLASFPTGYGNPRRNPITGHWFALIPGSGSGSTIDLVDMNTGETIFSTPNSWYYWTPRAFGFDSLGDLVIAADIVIPDVAWHLGLWRFEPGEQVVLDPSSPSALIPGVASNWGWQGEIAVTDDDVIYCVDGDNDPNPAKIWRVPGFDGSPYQRIQMPDSSAISPGYGFWYLATDCMGEGYAINPCLLDEGCWSNFVLYRLSDLAPIATMTDTQDFLALTNDRFANFYFETQKWDGAAWRRVVKRVRPEELPPGFYGYSLRSSAPDRLPEASSAPPYQPPPFLAACRSDQPPAACSTPGNQRILHTLEHADRARRGATRHLDFKRTAELESRSRTPVSTPVTCPLFPFPGSLKIRIILDPSKPPTGANVTWVDAATSTPVDALFGQAPLLEAYWSEGPTMTPIEVNWSIANVQTEPGIDLGHSLYPAQPAIMFGLLPNHATSVRLQTVHLGRMGIQALPTGMFASAGLVVPIRVISPTSLGGAHTRYDGLIVNAAHRYGIPPQYVKGQVDKESNGSFNPNAYRYEPRTIDRILLFHKAPSWWTRTEYEWYRYRLSAGPNSLITPLDVAPRQRYEMIQHIDSDVFPPANSYQCDAIPPGGNDPSIFKLVASNDGWPRCSIPWMLYNDANGNDACDAPPTDPAGGMIGPCGRRERWFNVSENNYLTVAPSLFDLGIGFFCGLVPFASECTSLHSDAEWFANHGAEPAQTLIAASYGLMQVLYTTAVQNMGWKAGANRAAERHPSFLFDPKENLDLGVGYLADGWIVGGNQMPFYASMSDYRDAIGIAYAKYNGKWYWSSSKEYANDILNNRVGRYPPLR